MHSAGLRLGAGPPGLRPGPGRPGRPCSASRTDRSQRGALRCRAGGRSEQNDFNPLTWGAKLIRRLGGARQPEQASDAGEVAEQPTPASEQQRRAEARAQANSSESEPQPSTSGRQLAAVAAAEPEAAGDGSGSEDEEEDSLTRRRRLYRHLNCADAITEEWPPASEPTWEDWQEVFEESDAREVAWFDLEAQLAAAVEAEDYAAAAELREQLAPIADDDALDALMMRYRQAVESEDFAEAARLRDEGGVGLLGWWWAHSSNADNPSHLLRVVRAFNRYMFLSYSPTDLTVVHGLMMKEEVGRAAASLGSGDDGEGDLPEHNPIPSKVEFDRAGHPVMELHYHAFPPSDEPAAASAAASGAASGAASEAAAAAAEAASEAASDSEGEEQELELRAQACAFAAADASDGLVFPGVLSDGAEDGEDGEGVHVSVSIVADEEGPLEALKEALQQHGLESEGVLSSLEAEADDGPPELPSEDTAAAAAAGEGEGLALPFAMPFAMMLPQLQRTPALIHKFEGDRDRFMVQILPTEAEEEAAAEAAAAAEAERAAAAAEAAAGAGGSAAAQPVEAQLVAAADSESERREMLAKILGAAKGKDGGRGISVRLEVKGALDNSKVDFGMLADEVARGSGGSIEAQGMADVLERVLQRVRDGAGGGAPAYEHGLKGSISYKRVDVCASRTDPFHGNFIGVFGNQAPEVMQLRRVKGKDGREWVQGMQLTGTKAMPAGTVAFRAAIGTKHRIPAHGYYPPELNVVGRYKGQGIMAGQTPRRAAKWVDGELLVFGSSFDFAKGAELGFLWNVGPDQKYLSLLQRIQLDDTLANDSDDE